MVRSILIVVVTLFLARTSAEHRKLPADVCLFFQSSDCATFRPRIICASNGINYPNECYFSKAHCNDTSIHMIYDGKECLPTTTTSDHLLSTVPISSLDCSVINRFNCSYYKPKLICASNGQTYKTECDFAKNRCIDPSLTIVSTDHECPLTTQTTSTTTNTQTNVTSSTTVITSQIYTSTTRPTPSTTAVNKTAANPNSSFVLLCRLLHAAQCSDNLNVVCTTNNNYRNTCEYQKAKCLNPEIQHLHNGYCGVGEGIPNNPSAYEIACQGVLNTTCPSNGPVVCDNHGQTYANLCKFRKTKCLLHGIELAACST